MKRSIVIAGHKTSVSLEDAFWNSLREIAAGKQITLSELVELIGKEHRHGNLSSRLRLFVLKHFQAQAAALNRVEQTTSSATGTTPE